MSARFRGATPTDVRRPCATRNACAPASPEIDVPTGTYAVFQTPCSRMPRDDYRAQRERIAEEWLPGSGCVLRDAPELALYYWPPLPDKADRFVEIWLPIER